jgi:hypothetical protein
MKKSILFLAISLLCALYTHATVITVSNNPNNPAQYSDLQTAIDAASAGDTIYVHGSTEDYGSITIKKMLVLIGSGFNPNNQFDYISKLQLIKLDIGTASNPSGTIIKGLYIHTISNTYAGNGIDNITISDNRITSKIEIAGRSDTNLSESWLIKNNVIRTIAGDSYYGKYFGNSLIINNIITYYLMYLKRSSILISNNLFYGGYMSNLLYCTLNNNIFYGTSTDNADYCTFNNNISIGGSQTTFIYDHNTGGNNLEDVDPQFMSVTSSGFSYDDDYRLKATSPGKNAGTDGTDIGIYGGSYPFPAFGDALYTGMPDIPQILEMNIMNSSLKATDSLAVQVKAVKAQQ